MIGVVLWSDPKDRKAVIWCEDQGDLAFLNTPESEIESQGFFDAGDVVQFDVELDCSIRRAHNPTLVLEKVGKSLSNALRVRSSDQLPPHATAEVIPFKHRAQAHSVPDIQKPAASGA
ncbi:MAG: hypothetical protein AAF636_06435 [Pseudomonadota bacterium]